MNRKTLEKFRRTLKDQRQNILEWLDKDSNHLAQLFGKDRINTKFPISPKKLQKISDINSAIVQIDKSNFGQCKLCTGEVETERLVFNFTEDICLDHYTESQKRDLENDPELAAKVHRNLLPSTVPVIQGIEIAAHSEPAGIVGGDYYDFFCFQNYMQGLVIADVMGKGLPASMLMSNLQASLRILGPENDEIEKTATRLILVIYFYYIHMAWWKLEIRQKKSSVQIDWLNI